MLFQRIEGRQLFSAGAMWFKVPDKSPNLIQIVNTRKQQILYYAGGNPMVTEALLTLANEGIFKSYDETFVAEIETLVKKMRQDGVTILR